MGRDGRGEFTSPRSRSTPALGGNPNPYTYPTDPINGSDLTGMFWGQHFLKKHWKVIRLGLEITATAVAVAAFCGTGVGCAIGVGAISGGFRGGINYKADHSRQRASGFWSAAARGALSGGAERWGIGRATGGATTSGFGLVRHLFRRML